MLGVPTMQKIFKTCLQSGSLEPAIDGDGCPINQNLVEARVTGLVVDDDDDGEGWSVVSDKQLELVGKDLSSVSTTLPLLVNISVLIYLTKTGNSKIIITVNITY